jgi:AcrR family transcriptional regulator
MTEKAPRGERRRKLVAAAKHWLATAGYSATTLDAIAAEAGVSVPQLQRSFDTVADFVPDLVEELLVAAQPAEELPGDALARLLYWTTHQLRHRTSADWQWWLRMLAHPVAELEVVLATVPTGLAEQVMPLLKAGQTTGVFRRSMNTNLAAQEWVRQVIGLMLVPTNEPLAQAFSVLIQGLLKTDI